MENLNLYLFSLLNAGANLSGFPLFCAIFVAKYMVYLVPLAWAASWLWGQTTQRNTLLLAAAAAALALLFNYAIALLWFHPRPFMLGIGHTYLTHAPDSSFPSDHVAFLWAIGLTYLACQRMRVLGVITLILGTCIGLARVYVGIHYPFDLLAAMATAGLAVSLLLQFKPLIERKLLPLAEYVYRKLFFVPIKMNWVKE